MIIIYSQNSDVYIHEKPLLVIFKNICMYVLYVCIVSMYHVAIMLGADLINDVSGGKYDMDMIPTAARLQVCMYVCMYDQCPDNRYTIMIFFTEHRRSTATTKILVYVCMYE